MKNQLRISSFLVLIGLCFCNLSKSQSNVTAVGTGEYVTTYLKNDGTAWVANQANVSIMMTQYPGLANIVGMDGMQYSTAAWDAVGNVYKLSNTATYTKIAVDNQGNPFTGNTLVRGLFQSCLSIRNGEVWYWGLDDVLNQTGGVASEVPVKLTLPPGNRIITDIQVASSTSFGTYSYAWGLANDGTLWQWDRTHTTAFQVSGGWGSSAIVKIALVGNWAKVVVTADNQMWGWGFTGDYVGAAPEWQNSNPVNITNFYSSKGVSFPLKELVGGSNTLHLIDANDNLFGVGDNVMGEVGNGGGNSFWATAPIPYNWSWNAYGEMSGLVQIPGKFKNFRAGNTVTFYKYVQDLEGNWYSWGRNKSFSLGNGISLPSYPGYPGTTGINYADNPNYYDITGLRKVTPLTQAWVITPSASRNDIRPPLAYAGADRVFPAGTNNVTLYGAVKQLQPTSLLTLTTFNQWTLVSGPNAATIVTAGALVSQVNNLIPGIYNFRNTVTNILGMTDFQETKVTILGSAVNQPPVANAGGNVSITLPVNSATLNGSGTDPDGTIFSYTWQKIGGPVTGTLSNSNTATATAANLVEGDYYFELTVTDNVGAAGRDTMKLTVISAANQLPTANAGPDISITLPVNNATLSGSGTDPDGTIFSYTWQKIGGPVTGTLSNANTATATAANLVEGDYYFELTVTDNVGAAGRDTMKLTVISSANQLPTANAGPDISITLPVSSATLNGSGTDPDGTIISYTWQKIGGPVAGTLSNANTATATANSLVSGVYYFELTVTDNVGAAGRDTMKLTVISAANQLPTANAGPDISITLPVSSATLNGSGTDPDGTIFSYTWQKVGGPVAGTLSNANTATATANSLVAGVYYFELTVTDNVGAAGRDTMSLTVTPAANQTPTANAGPDITITLPVNFTALNGSGNDPDGSITSYNWQKIAGPATGTINNSNTASANMVNLVAGIYILQLTVTDNVGATAKDSMLLTVLAAPNALPTANAGADINIMLPVNTVVLAGSGSDPDGLIIAYLWTKLSGPSVGTLTNANTASPTLNGLVAGVYQYQLTVTDNNGATAKDTVKITVSPAPNIKPIANAGADMSIYLPDNSIALVGSGVDPDGTILSFKWKVVSGPAQYYFGNDGEAQTSLTNLMQGVYVVELTVTDNVGAIGSDSVVITVGASRTSAQQTEDKVNIYPNPVTTILNADISSSKGDSRVKMMLFDTKGVLVYHEDLLMNATSQIKQINMANMRSGVYILTIEFDAKTRITKKIIKN